MSGSCRPERYWGDSAEVWSGHRMAAALAEYIPGETRDSRTSHHGAGLRSDGFGVYWAGMGSAKGLVYVSVTGEAFGGLGEVEALEILRMLDGWGVTASRFDLCRDVPALSVAELRTRVLDREVQTRAHSIDYREGLRGASGRTVYVGAPDSDRRLRVYDMRGPTRIEVQLRRAFAAAAVERVTDFTPFLREWRRQVDEVLRCPGWTAWAEALA